jgi:DNA-binding transcriptional regulator YhcF (GntR family)
VVNPYSGHTVSRHFASLLRERIAAGVLPPGTQMPSEAELSREYGLAPQTVRRALRTLHEEGMLVQREGEVLFVREAEIPVTVTLQPGDRVSARMPTLKESLVMGISQHVPLLVVTRASGATERYTGAATRLAAGG